MKPANYEYQSDFARKYFAEGRAGLLLKQLQLKFGPLPDGVTSRVQSAGLDELDRWGELVLSARSIEDVLG